MPTIYQIIVIGLLTAFVILLLIRTGWRDKARNWCDCYEAPIVAKLIDCDFCLCFWLSLLIAVLFSAYTGDSSYAFTPFLATPLARYLL